MAWKVMLWQFILGLVWVALIDAIFFPKENLFVWIAVIFFIVFPIINFLYKLTNTILTSIVMGKSIEENTYQAWIDAKFPLIDPSDIPFMDVDDYLQKVAEWPDATRDQSNSASAVLATFQAAKFQGMLVAYSQLKLLKKVYERYMKDNRHNWDTQSAFANYVKGY